jgi:hypothetical protein
MTLANFSGDSYSSIEFDPHGDLPQPGNPLGNPPFPGRSRDQLPNWVSPSLDHVDHIGGLFDD